MKKGIILGHEAVGIVEALGDDIRNLQIGDRVVVPSTIPAVIVRIAGRAITPSVIMQIPMENLRELHFLVGRKIADRLMD